MSVGDMIDNPNKLALALIEWRAAHDALGQLQEDWLNGKRDFTNTDESGVFMDRIAVAHETLRATMDGAGDAYAACFCAGAEAMREAAAKACEDYVDDGDHNYAATVRALPIPELIIRTISEIEMTTHTKYQGEFVKPTKPFPEPPK